MAKSRESLVDKVRKLIDRAKDQAGENEGDSAAATARKLIREHAIEDSELLAAERREQGIEEKAINVKMWPEWKRDLLAECAIHAGNVDGIDPETETAYLYGFPGSIELSLYLFETVLRGLESEYQRTVAEMDAYVERMKSNPIGRNFNAKAKAQETLEGFYVSAVSALRVRLERMRNQEAVSDPKGTALVRQGEQRIEAFLAAVDVQVASDRDLAPPPPSFSGAGHRAGVTVPLNPGIAGPTSAPPGAPSLGDSSRGRQLTDHRGARGSRHTPDLAPWERDVSIPKPVKNYYDASGPANPHAPLDPQDPRYLKRKP